MNDSWYSCYPCVCVCVCDTRVVMPGRREMHVVRTSPVLQNVLLYSWTGLSRCTGKCTVLRKQNEADNEQIHSVDERFLLKNSYNQFFLLCCLYQRPKRQQSRNNWLKIEENEAETLLLLCCMWWSRLGRTELWECGQWHITIGSRWSAVQRQCSSSDQYIIIISHSVIDAQTVFAIHATLLGYLLLCFWTVINWHILPEITFSKAQEQGCQSRF